MIVCHLEKTKVENFLNEGWEEFGTPLKTKTKLRKTKSHNEKKGKDGHHRRWQVQLVSHNHP